MPRNKVDPALRRRVVRACDACKRRKEKCSGTAPCDQCSSRQQETHCKYTKTIVTATATSTTTASPRQRSKSHDQRPLLREAVDSSPKSDRDAYRTLDALEDRTAPSVDVSRSEDVILPNSAPLSQVSTILRDSNGKFIYVGESASLSFLQIVRKAFEVAVGDSDFAADTLRHQMTETSPPLRFDKTLEPTLDVVGCKALVEQYCLVASGLMDLFDPGWLQDLLPAWLADSSRSERLDAPLVYLVLAIGAQARAQEDVGNALAEQCFGYGRKLAILTLMDNPSLLTVQVFILITYYMISACRRNAACSNLGVAIKAAYALGIHRHETNILFVPDEGIARERAWKTLRVCDCFLSASLGRPLGSSESDCNIPWTPLELRTGRDVSVSSQVSSAIFRICHIFERVLVEVYTRRTVSLELAGSISGQLREWTEGLPHMLRIDGLDETNQQQSLGSSHRLGNSVVTMAYYWSIILLSRPFLTFKVCHYKRRSSDGATTPSNSELNTYADACVDSAIKGIDLAYTIAFLETMPCRHPVIVNNVFSSSLCIGLAFLGDYDKRGWPLQLSLDRGITILRHFGRFDPLSARYFQVCQLLQATAETHIRNRDKALVQTKNNMIRNVFGHIGLPESDDLHAAELALVSTPQLVRSRSESQGQQQQITAAILTPQPSIWEQASPPFFDDYALQQESLITTSGFLTTYPDHGGDHPYHNQACFGDFAEGVASDTPYGFASGENMSLFSLTNTMALEAEFVDQG